MELSLLELKPGQRGVVSRIMGGLGFRRRLECMGIKEGKEIVKISSQPFSGPVIIEIDRSHVAIGRGIAARIILEV